MTEGRREIQFPIEEGEASGGLRQTNCFSAASLKTEGHQMKPGRAIAIQLHFTNCAGTEQEAKVSTRCKHHKSDQEANEHTQGLIFLLIPAHSRRESSKIDSAMGVKSRKEKETWEVGVV